MVSVPTSIFHSFIDLSLPQESKIGVPSALVALLSPQIVAVCDLNVSINVPSYRCKFGLVSEHTWPNTLIWLLKAMYIFPFAATMPFMLSSTVATVEKLEDMIGRSKLMYFFFPQKGESSDRELVPRYSHILFLLL